MLPSFLSVVLSLCLFGSVLGVPLIGDSQLVRRQSLAPPYWAVYSDDWVSGGAPTVTEIYGFNVYILSFLTTYGAADQAQNWEELDSGTQATILSDYHAAGIKLMVSAFGSTQSPTSSGDDPTTTAQTMAAWVIQYGLDGIDVDYEDFDAMNAQDGSAETWLTTFTQALRAALPSPQYLLTHAPVAPWFCGTALYASGAYITVNSNVGSLIDWYNIQFYNQGTSEYTTCEGLLDESSSTWPNSALFQIAESVTLNKLVIGKPANTNDASNGYMTTSLLATCVQQAQAAGWSAGVMTWEYPDAQSAWIEAVRADSWPVSGSPPPPATTTPATTTYSATATPTATASSGGNCAGVSAWNSQTAYTGGEEVTYGGDLWSAQYWTEDSTPGGSAGVWTNEGACT